MPASAFTPPFWARNGWVQTLGALCWPTQPVSHPNFASTLHTMPLPDGDALALTLHCAKEPGTRRRVILVHGLCGDQESNYMRRSAMRLMQAGYDLCLVNLRGSGPGFDLASQPYHAGRSEDVAAVVNWLKQRSPEQGLDLIGYSLGANIVLKYLAEASEQGDFRVQRAMAISPPIDLEASCNCLMNSPLGLADRFFARLLVQHVERVHQARPDLGPPPQWPKPFNVRIFDEIYTAPRGGFESASHYYQYASAQYRLEKIKIPTKMVWSKDDDLIDQPALANAKVSPQVQRLATQRGGHIGYVDPRASGWQRFWLIDQLPHWLATLPFAQA